MPSSVVRNAADARQVREGGKKERQLQRQEMDDIRAILELPAGRRFYWRLLCMCRVFELSWTGNSETFFNEGQRNIGLRLLNDLTKSNPKAYLQMMEEDRRIEEAAEASEPAPKKEGEEG